MRWIHLTVLTSCSPALNVTARCLEAQNQRRRLETPSLDRVRRSPRGHSSAAPSSSNSLPHLGSLASASPRTRPKAHKPRPSSALLPRTPVHKAPPSLAPLPKIQELKDRRFLGRRSGRILSNSKDSSNSLRKVPHSLVTPLGNHNSSNSQPLSSVNRPGSSSRPLQVYLGSRPGNNNNRSLCLALGRARRCLETRPKRNPRSRTLSEGLGGVRCSLRLRSRRCSDLRRGRRQGILCGGGRRHNSREYYLVLCPSFHADVAIYLQDKRAFTLLTTSS